MEVELPVDSGGVVSDLLIARLHKWTVFAASLVVSFLDFGFAVSMGAMYIGILNTFNAGRAKTALVQSLLITFCWGFGAIGGFLISVFGISKVTYLAAPMSAVGFLASYFATSVYQLYGFISVITGMGFSTIYVSAVTCVGRTFTGRQKSMVLAVQSVGTAVSGFMWPNLLTASIQSYGLRGLCLLLCGIFLNNIPAAIIFANCSSSKNKEKNIKPGEIDKGFEESKHDPDQGLDTVGSLEIDSSDRSHESKCQSPDASQTNRDRTCTSRSQNYHTMKESSNNSRVLKDNIEAVTPSINPISRRKCFSKICCLYSIYVAAGVLNMSILSGFLSVYQDINVSNGLTISQSDLSFMSFSLLNILSRFLPIIPAKFPKINSFVVPVFSSLCGVIGQLIFLFGNSFTSTIFAMAFTAVSDGGWIASMQAILFEILPPKYQATGFGFMLTAMGIVSAATGPIFGFIRDDTSSYQIVLISMAAIFFVSAVLEVICMMISRSPKKAIK